MATLCLGLAVAIWRGPSVVAAACMLVLVSPPPPPVAVRATCSVSTSQLACSQGSHQPRPPRLLRLAPLVPRVRACLSTCRRSRVLDAGEAIRDVGTFKKPPERRWMGDGGFSERKWEVLVIFNCGGIVRGVLLSRMAYPGDSYPPMWWKIKKLISANSVCWKVS